MSESIKVMALKVNWEIMEEIIDFYETNQLYFNNYNTISDIDSIINLIHFKQRYIEALESKKRYSKALPILTEVDILLQKIKKEEIYKKVYERYMFLSGLIYGRLNRNHESFEYFIELRTIDPENDLYKNWYVSLKSNIWYNQFRILSYIGMGLIFLDIILGLFFDSGLNKFIVLIALIVMVAGIVFPYITKYIIKNKLNG